jgi:hypothetical protein
MTVRELKNELEKFKDSDEVWIIRNHNDDYEEFRVSLVDEFGGVCNIYACTTSPDYY